MRYSPEKNNLPIGTQSFEILRSENCVYVDKTEHIYNLVTGGRAYFLSRPRRFGKSLLISTLEALFRCRRELFKNTWIAGAAYDWTEYPVIRIDMTQTNKKSIEGFNESLTKLLLKHAKCYQIEMETSKDPSQVLDDLISKFGESGRKVVVLVDEYDKPILDNITNEVLAGEIRDALRQFYSILKAQDENLKFVMLTGITNSSKVSVFSGLNNLKDVTMTDRYAAICGYTQAELEHTFVPWIENLAKEQDTTEAEQLSKIKRWYNGYQFSKGGMPVYNPFSTLNLFDDLAYEHYWFVTGTPKFLLDLIQERSFFPQNLNNLIVMETDLQIHDMHDMDVVALLYQTGYLTIKNYNVDSRNFTLGYPNFEVDEAFTEALFKYFSRALPARSITVDELVAALTASKYDEVFKILQTFFAAIAYQLHTPREAYYHSLFYLIFHLAGLRINAEIQSNLGRFDALIEFENRVLIFEFKLDQTAQIALEQIHDKRYYEPFQNQNKEIILFGVNFSTTEKNITEWQQEALS